MYCQNLSIDRNSEIVAITKGNETSLVCHFCNIMMVVSAAIKVNNVPLVKILKVCSTESEAHDEFLHVIGKLTIKDVSSKYFENPKYYEHMSNGVSKDKGLENMYDSIIAYANQAVSVFLNNGEKPGVRIYNVVDMTLDDIKRIFENNSSDTLLRNLQVSDLKAMYEQVFGRPAHGNAEKCVESMRDYFTFGSTKTTELLNLFKNGEYTELHSMLLFGNVTIKLVRMNPVTLGVYICSDKESSCIQFFGQYEEGDNYLLRDVASGKDDKNYYLSFFIHYVDESVDEPTYRKVAIVIPRNGTPMQMYEFSDWIDSPTFEGFYIYSKETGDFKEWSLCTTDNYIKYMPNSMQLFLSFKGSKVLHSITVVQNISADLLRVNNAILMLKVFSGTECVYATALKSLDSSNRYSLTNIHSGVSNGLYYISLAVLHEDAYTGVIEHRYVALVFSETDKKSYELDLDDWLSCESIHFEYQKHAGEFILVPSYKVTDFDSKVQKYKQFKVEKDSIFPANALISN